MNNVTFTTSFKINLPNGNIEIIPVNKEIGISISENAYGPMEQGGSYTQLLLTEEEFLEFANAIEVFKNTILEKK